MAQEIVKRRPERPDRATLERLLRASDGKLTRVAALLDVSRPTLYKWLYQLDLASVAGVSSTYGDSSTYAAYSSMRQPAENTKKAVKPEPTEAPTLQDVNSAATTATDLRVNTSIRIRESVWKRMRKRAIDEGRPVAELLEEASEAYLQHSDENE